MELTIRKKAEASASFLHFLKNETFRARRDKTVGAGWSKLHLQRTFFGCEKWKDLCDRSKNTAEDRRVINRQRDRSQTRGSRRGKTPNETKKETLLLLTFPGD